MVQERDKRERNTMAYGEGRYTFLTRHQAHRAPLEELHTGWIRKRPHANASTNVSFGRVAGLLATSPGDCLLLEGAETISLGRSPDCPA